MAGAGAANPNDPQHEQYAAGFREETWIALSHEYDSTILNSFYVLEQVEQLLAAQNPFATKLSSSEAILALFRPPLSTLVDRLSSLGATAATTSGHQTVPFREFASRLATYTSAECHHFTAEVIRQTIADVLIELKSLTPQDQPETELKNEVFLLCRHIRLLLCLYAIAETKPRLLKCHRDSVSFRTTAALSKEPLHASTATFDSLVRDSLQAVRPFAEQRRIDIRDHWGCDNALVSGDLKALSRALKALLDNAIKYNWQLPKHKGNGWVTIRTSASFQYVEVTIENWGTAIEPEEIASGKIFLPRTRGKHAEEQVANGTGHGLPYAKAVIERDHGGWLRVRTRPARSHVESQGGPQIITVQAKLPRFG